MTNSYSQSEVDSLVAAAVEACAKHHASSSNARERLEKKLTCECGEEFYGIDVWRKHIRSTVTPEAAKKELERIKAEARLEGRKWEHEVICEDVECGGLGGCPRHKTIVAALEAAARKEQSL